MEYYFSKNDSGIIGKAFEMEIKRVLNRSNADRISPAGQCDFIYKRVHYDVKSNGTVLQYHAGTKYIKGSSRVIYATHVAHTLREIDGERVGVTVDLSNTDLLVVDRDSFVKFLVENGMCKMNAARGTVNVQTVYNYKKDKYHGRKGYAIESWAFENECDYDSIIDTILENID